MKVLFLDKIYSDLKNNLTRNGIICVENPTENKNQILKKIHQFDGIVLRSRLKIDRDFIRKSSHLKFIARFGSGMENIDVLEAKKYQIECINAPKGNSNAVGEHSLGLLLSLMNNINASNLEVKNGMWKREKNRGIELSKKTIGIIGYGNAGKAFSEKLIGFNCKILAYDKYKKNYQNKFVKESSIKKIFKHADIVSLHIPLTKETEYLINNDFLNRFSKNIFLLNTSRGKIVKTSDLITNLKSGKILGAGLDVLENESKSFEKLNKTKNSDLDFLKTHEKVILTPHIAGWSFESNKLMCKILTKKILYHLKTIK